MLGTVYVVKLVWSIASVVSVTSAHGHDSKSAVKLMAKAVFTHLGHPAGRTAHRRNDQKKH